MVIKGDSLKYLENLEIDMKKVFLSGIAGSIGVKYVGESDTLAWAFEYFTVTINLQLSKKRLSASQYFHYH